MKRETRVGLTVIASIFLLYVMLTWVQRIHIFSPEEEKYTLIFQDVAGLLEGDPVEIRGFTVGRVDRIAPTAKQVQVDIWVDKKIILYEGVTAEVQVKELMGGKKVSLWPGNGAQTHPSNQHIPGKASLDFSTAFSKTGQILEELKPQSIEPLLLDLQGLIHSLRNVSEQIANSQPEVLLGKMSKSLDKIEYLLGQIEKESLIGTTKNTLASTQALVENANQSLGGFDSLLNEQHIIQKTGHLLSRGESSLSRIDSLSEQMNQVLKQINTGHNTLNTLLYDEVFAQRLDSTLGLFIQVLEQIRNEKIIVGVTVGKGKDKEKDPGIQ